MTIKYNTDPAGNIKVITKDGKVSCECCEECCMYPAQGLADELYTSSDLPDSINFNYILNSTTGTLQLNKSGTRYSGTVSGIGLVEFFVEFRPQSIPVSWAYSSIRQNPSDSAGPNGSTQCLFRDFIDFPIKDQFADSYAISGPISGTVTRESICVWRGPNLRLTNFGFQWKVNGNNKSGLQNTPVGSYAGGFTVS
jgi:hypothetical protein